MCGIAGIYDIHSKNNIDRETLISMTDAIEHRGPDDKSYFVKDNIGLGFRRLSIIDLEHGQQPFFNYDKSVVSICNGEIYNYKELRKELIDKGYHFKTECDVEVVVHLYTEYGIDFVKRLNGQFGFVLYDFNKKCMYLARDHFGICPVFYTVKNDHVIFGSEIKAILKHPFVKREVNLTGLDQIFSFPGNVSPNTMFKGIESLKPGYILKVTQDEIQTYEYWDLDYPEHDYNYPNRSEASYVEELEEKLIRSVSYRMNADVPIGFYLSGGLDSSLISGLMKSISPDKQFDSFSIGFPDVDAKEHDERSFQRMMSEYVESSHHEIDFYWKNVEENLRRAVYYGECPLKETYNTCSLALSENVHNNNIKVILSGEGSDELLGGYVGYRFDQQRVSSGGVTDLDELLEEQTREKLWGDSNFFYEKKQHEFSETKLALYSDEVGSNYETFSSINHLGIDKNKLANRHMLHKRSYLDLKLRLSDHLISDHSDRVAYANSVEGRYPFLDIDLVEFIRTIPPDLKLNGMVEKYILKEVAKKYVPSDIVNRQKFSFVAPNSQYLLKNKVEWVNDILSYDTIKRQGYFNPNTIERLKKRYSQPNFTLNMPYDDDLLIIVITFGLFLDVFEMPSL